MKPDGIPKNPQTLGQHLLARRLTLKLRQKDVGKLLGTDQFSVINWEKDRTSPAIRFYPAILAFLGYDPFPVPTALAERLRAKRRSLGLSIHSLAARLGVDPGRFADWEREGLVLYKKHRTMLANLLGIPAEELHQQFAKRWGQRHAR